MKTFFYLALTLAVASPAHARRDAEDFAGSIETIANTTKNIDALQAASSGPWMTVGPRCLNNWEKYKKDYEGYIAQLKDKMKPGVQAIEDYNKAVKDVGEGSTGLSLSDACSAKGPKIEKDILKRMVEVKKAVKTLGPVSKQVDDLFGKVIDALVNDAVKKDYSRGPSCLFKYQYTDVALLAVARDYYPHGGNAPSPAFYELRNQLRSVEHFGREEVERLTQNLARLNHLRMSCDAAREAGATEPDGEENPGTGSAQ